MAISPAEDQMRLALCFAQKVRAGSEYTLETFRAAYLETLEPNGPERANVSDAWSSLLWSRLKGVPVEEFLRSSKSPLALGDLLYRVWGKAV